MTCSSLLASLCSLLLFACPVAAQTTEAASPDVAEELAAPSLELEPEVLAPPAPASADDPLARRFFGPLAGMGMIAASTVVGALIGLMVPTGCEPGAICFGGPLLGMLIGASIGAGVGLPLFYPLGVALGADAAGGRGGIGWSALGGLIGTAIGVGLYFAAWGIQSETGAEWAAVMVPAIVLGAGAALVGPVVAYELSDHSARAQPARAGTEVTWIPTLGIDAHGGRAGVAGSF